MAKPNSPRPDIGRRLGRLMEDSEDLQSQWALSRKSKVSQTTIGRILRGEVSPGISVLTKLAKALDVRLEQLTSDLPYSPALPTNDAKTQPGRASQSARMDGEMLIAADKVLELLAKTEGVEFDRQTRLRRLAELYNLALEDGGSLSVARLQGMMEDALWRRERAKGHERGAGSGASESRKVKS